MVILISLTILSMKLRSHVMRPVGILALGLVLLGGSFFITSQVHAQTVTGTASAVAHMNIKPVGIFEKLKLIFTLNAERKAAILADFSKRNFELAKEKLEAGKSDESKHFLDRSDKDAEKASKAAAEIRDNEKRSQALVALAAALEHRTEVLTAVMEKVENPNAKEAIQRAIDKQIEVKATVSEKIESLSDREPGSENKGGVSAGVNASAKSGNTGTSSALGLGVAATVGPLSKCLPTSAPSITVLSPNGGETYTAGQQITVKWRGCRLPSDRVVVSLYNVTNNSYTYFSGTLLDRSVPNSGSLTVNLPVQNSTFLTLTGSSTSFVTGTNFKVRVNAFPAEENTIEDYSDSLFTIN